MSTAPPALAAEQAALRSDRFRLEREGDWKRLEGIVARMERGRLSRISDADILALPVLYRTVASSLSVARETSLDAGTLGYLESLAQRAWFLVYGPRVGLVGWLRRFLGGGWGQAVRGLGLDLAIALGAMIAGVLVGYLLVASDPAWFSALVPEALGDVRRPGASAAALRGTLYGQQGEAGLSIFAAALFSNNAQVSILAFALGFAFALPSLLLLVHNMGGLGAMLWLFGEAGLLPDFVAWLAVHGTTELFAIFLAGAAGVHVGRALAFPGELAALDAAAAAGRRAAVVMTGVVLMLIAAALLEGFARQLVEDPVARIAIGAFMLVFWIGYLFTWRRAGPPA
ncbi:MAG TPA: stage II sporulation protein M [Novosphingobium sp.]|nr:stage II sporulation protein M [Novosphingobium sp.]